MLNLYCVTNMFRTTPSFVRHEDANRLLLGEDYCDLEPGCMHAEV